MSTYTTNLNLKKPELSEQFKLADWNSNSDILDAYAGTVNTALAGITTALEGKASTADVTAALATKQDTLQYDSKPTESSTKMVNSGGLFPIQNALAAIIDTTYKQNVLENTAETATIGNEVEFVVNADGSITATCLATTTAQRNFDYVSTVPAGTWWFSTGQPLSGGTTSDPCYCAINKSGTARCNDFNPEKQTLTVDETTNFQFRTVIRSGVAAGTTLKFYPMLCLKKWYDVSPAYIPHSATT